VQDHEIISADLVIIATSLSTG